MPQKPPTPEDFARVLRARFKVHKAVDLHDLASKIGLEVREVEADGFEGTLVRADAKAIGIIAVKNNIREHSRRRFTIAHEMGHFILPGHGDLLSVCLSRDIESWGKSVPEHEIAANRFASELIMPSELVTPIVQNLKATIVAAKDVSENFQVSLTAAVVRCIDLTEENCALVVSEKGVIRWWRPSPRFDQYVVAGTKVSEESLAHTLYSAGGGRESDGAVPAKTWLGGYDAQKLGKVWEDSIYLPFYRRVLSIITIR